MSQGDPQPQGQEEVSWGGPGERPGRAGGGFQWLQPGPRVTHQVSFFPPG